MTNTRSRRRWFSYSLRGLLLAITGFAIWLGSWANSAHNQKAAIEAILTVDPAANISYDDDPVEGMHTGPSDSVNEPRWARVADTARRSWALKFVRDALGEDYFRNVVSVSFGDAAEDPVPTAAETQVFRKIARLRHLNQLAINFAANDSDVARIVMSRSLKLLEFSQDCPQLTDKALQFIARVSCLRSLTIRNAPITDAGLAHLKNMPQLDELVLGKVDWYLKELVLGKVDWYSHPANEFKITDAGLASLAELKNLRILKIKSEEITGEGLKHLARLENLRSLHLECPLFKDEDLQALASLTKLNDLNLVGTTLTAPDLSN